MNEDVRTPNARTTSEFVRDSIKRKTVRETVRCAPNVSRAIFSRRMKALARKVGGA